MSDGYTSVGKIRDPLKTRRGRENPTSELELDLDDVSHPDLTDIVDDVLVVVETVAGLAADGCLDGLIPSGTTTPSDLISTTHRQYIDSWWLCMSLAPKLVAGAFNLVQMNQNQNFNHRSGDVVTVQFYIHHCVLRTANAGQILLSTASTPNCFC